MKPSSRLYPPLCPVRSFTLRVRPDTCNVLLRTRILRKKNGRQLHRSNLPSLEDRTTVAKGREPMQGDEKQQGNGGSTEAEDMDRRENVEETPEATKPASDEAVKQEEDTGTETTGEEVVPAQTGPFDEDDTDEAVERVLQQETPQLSPMERVLNVFFDPSAVAEDILRKPTWLIPFLFSVVLMVAGSIIAMPVMMDFQMDMARDALMERGVSGDQLDNILEQQRGFMPVSILVFGPLGLMFFVFIYTLLFVFIGNIILGGTRKFAHYWSLEWHTTVISMVGALLTNALVRVTGDMQGTKLGLGLLTRGDVESTAHKIASGFDLFTMWAGIAIGIGLAVFTKKSKTVGIAIGLGLYVGLTIVMNLLGGSWGM
ncbi:hypothetical protein GF324_02945 [bacterium]|nr:hypothetical protein [bacterium]